MGGDFPCPAMVLKGLNGENVVGILQRACLNVGSHNSSCCGGLDSVAHPHPCDYARTLPATY